RSRASSNQGGHRPQLRIFAHQESADAPGAYPCAPPLTSWSPGAEPELLGPRIGHRSSVTLGIMPKGWLLLTALSTEFSFSAAWPSFAHSRTRRHFYLGTFWCSARTLCHGEFKGLGPATFVLAALFGGSINYNPNWGVARPRLDLAQCGNAPTDSR